MNDSLDNAAAGVAILIGLAIFAVLGLLALLIYVAITYFIVKGRYEAYYIENQAYFDYVMKETGAAHTFDDEVSILFGMQTDPNYHDNRSTVDWFAETIIGGREDDAAQEPVFPSN